MLYTLGYIRVIVVIYPSHEVSQSLFQHHQDLTRTPRPTQPEVKTFKLDNHDIPTETTTTKEETWQYIKEMETMRRMEIACDQLYKNREIRGFCHLYDGQEAIAEGMEAAMTMDDALIGAYRIHCQAYKRGFTVRQIVAEMLGKKTGATQGKGGSMHYYNKETNFYGGNGIVGAQMPVGTGIAFALKYLKKPNICVSSFGDGAANQGQLFEAANMAKLWNLPIIYLCENNLFGMGTSVERSSANVNFYTRGDTIPGIRFNGNNVYLVREVMKWAKNYSLQNGPLFLEAVTYRYHGHSMSDPGLTYRTRDQVQEQKQKDDPILLAKRLLLENKSVTEEEIKVVVL